MRMYIILCLLTISLYSCKTGSRTENQAHFRHNLEKKGISLSDSKISKLEKINKNRNLINITPIDTNSPVEIEVNGNKIKVTNAGINLMQDVENTEINTTQMTKNFEHIISNEEQQQEEIEKKYKPNVLQNIKAILRLLLIIVLIFIMWRIKNKYI